MLYETAARASEIAAINVADLDLGAAPHTPSAPKAATAAPASGGAQPTSQNGQI
jgi:hypothetical protein